MISVITVTTDINGSVVFYDAKCAVCTAWARRAERVLKGRGIGFQPLPERAEEMKVLRANGDELGGVAAAVYLARQVCWTWPLWTVSRLPGMMWSLTRGYRWIAARRYCGKGGGDVAGA